MSGTTDVLPTATLSIAIADLPADLLAQLRELGADIVDLASLDQPLVIDLPTPITMGDDQLRQITIPEPTAAQMEMWSSLTGTTAEIKAVSVMAAIPVGVVKQLPARVFVKAVARINAFLS